MPYEKCIPQVFLAARAMTPVAVFTKTSAFEQVAFLVLTGRRSMRSIATLQAPSSRVIADEMDKLLEMVWT